MDLPLQGTVPMAKDDDEARKARAKRLHEKIDHVLGRGEGSAGSGPPPEENAEEKKESPRDFVERRMRETRGK